jgi:hypothetical protein
MSTNNSNAPQRNRAILNATLLMLLLMLLAGVGGWSFTKSKQLEAFEQGEGFANKMARLEQLDKDCQNLMAWFIKVEQICAEIKKKDEGWEKAVDQAGLKNQIGVLEDDLSDLVIALKKESKDTLLAPRAVNAYTGVISARGEIWKWRGKSTLPPPPPDDPMGNLKQKAWMIAQQLDQKSDSILDVTKKLKGQFDKKDREDLERYASDLKSIANQLRSI